MGKIKALMETMLGKAKGVASLDENGRNAQPPATHAAQHAIGGSDQITPEMIGAGRVNPNLLDNWYFRNPVDQRGGYVAKPEAYIYVTPGDTSSISGTLTEYLKVTNYRGDFYTGTLNGGKVYFYMDDVVRGYTGEEYGIDRWKTDIDKGGAVLVTDDGIQITAAGTYWGTRIENTKLYKGMRLTGSALTSDGVLHCGTILFENTPDFGQSFFSDSSLTFYILPFASGVAQVEFNAKTDNVSILAAKLELGSTQTLARQDADGNWVLNDPPPNKALELAKCQRYYQLFTSAEKRPTDKRDFRPELRTNATSANTGTIMIDGVTYYYADANI